MTTARTTTVTPLINAPYGSGAGLCNSEDGWYYYDQALGQYYVHSCMAGNFGIGYQAANFDNSWTFANCIDACVARAGTSCMGVLFAPSQSCFIETSITSGGYLGGVMIGYKVCRIPSR